MGERRIVGFFAVKTRWKRWQDTLVFLARGFSVFIFDFWHPLHIYFFDIFPRCDEIRLFLMVKRVLWSFNNRPQVPGTHFASVFAWREPFQSKTSSWLDVCAGCQAIKVLKGKSVRWRRDCWQPSSFWEYDRNLSKCHGVRGNCFAHRRFSIQWSSPWKRV